MVFVFKAEGEPGIRGQSVIDCLTACYEAFGGRLDAAGELMTCTCDACLSIGGLDLKFVLHHGEYVVQSVAGRQELLGPDVTISHLLLKNNVADLIGRSAYGLVTEPAVGMRAACCGSCLGQVLHCHNPCVLKQMRDCKT